MAVRVQCGCIVQLVRMCLLVASLSRMCNSYALLKTHFPLLHSGAQRIYMDFLPPEGVTPKLGRNTTLGGFSIFVLFPVRDVTVWLKVFGAEHLISGVFL